MNIPSVYNIQKGPLMFVLRLQKADCSCGGQNTWLFLKKAVENLRKCCSEDFIVTKGLLSGKDQPKSLRLGLPVLVGVR